MPCHSPHEGAQQSNAEQNQQTGCVMSFVLPALALPEPRGPTHGCGPTSCHPSLLLLLLLLAAEAGLWPVVRGGYIPGEGHHPG
jgi:hypothetical protein